MKILITGGVGYLGNIISKKLLDRNDEVIIIDNFMYGTNGCKELYNTEIIEDEVKNIKKYEKYIKDVDVVFHLAGQRLLNITKTEVLGYFEDLKILYDISVKNNVKKFVFPSSCSVYGYREKKVSEKDDVNLTSLYAELKYKSEVLLSDFNEISTIIARPATLFGVSNLMRYDSLINDFINSIKNKNNFDVYGKNTWRANLYVSDCADIFLGLLDKDFEGIVNVGFDGLNLSKQNILSGISKVIGSDISRYVNYVNDDDIRSYTVDFSKLESLINHNFITLQEGVSKLLYEY